MRRDKYDKFLKEKSNGNKSISPVLPDGIKNYLIDIDGTITDDIPNEQPERMSTCLPFPDALDTCNKWYDEGHMICFFTSRAFLFISKKNRFPDAL